MFKEANQNANALAQLAHSQGKIVSFIFILFYDISCIYSGATTGLIPIYVTVY